MHCHGRIRLVDWRYDALNLPSQVTDHTNTFGVWTKLEKTASATQN
jgi:hypothetical protein